MFKLNQDLLKKALASQKPNRIGRVLNSKNVVKGLIALAVTSLLCGCASHAVIPTPFSHISAVKHVKDTKPVASNGLIRVGRYQTTKDLPTIAQSNPFLTVASFKFGPYVKNIGEAVKQVLHGTGYRLVPLDQLPKQARYVLEKVPVPVVQRTLGPITVHRALEILINRRVFNLVIEDAG